MKLPAAAIAVCCVAALLLTSCAAGPQPLQLTRAAHLETNTSAAETDAILRAIEQGLRDEAASAAQQTHGALIRAALQSVQVDGHLALVAGCGTFRYVPLRESYAITLIAAREGSGWALHSWQVETDGLHGERQSCR